MTLKNQLAKCKSWADFIELVQGSANTKIKGDYFELVVQEYLRSSSLYGAVIRRVWLEKEVPYSLRESLNLPSRDMGIDLIAETYGGEYWAIQCKFHGDTRRSLTWKEVSTFTSLAFGVCRNISFGLICTTGEKYVDILKQHEKLGVCSSLEWESLDKLFFDNFQDDTGRKTLPPLIPRPHQQIAIDKSKTYFNYNERGKLTMPCGTGKSLTSFWINQSLDSTLTLVAVPSIALMRQTFQVWSREIAALGLQDQFRWMCVCSDDSVTRRDDAIYNAQDLGVPSTTNGAEIKKWLKTSTSKHSVLFTTYQSSKVVCEAAADSEAIFDFGIFDEAHKTVGAKTSLFSLMLSDNNIRVKKRLFMTATERHYVGASSNIASMDDENLYGKTIELLTFKQALLANPKIVADYKVLTLFITKAEVQNLVLNKAHVSVAGIDVEDVNAGTLAAMIALDKAAESYPIKHTVSFHSSIKKAEGFKDLAEQYSSRTNSISRKIIPYHVNGKQSASTRQRILDDFAESDKSLVTNSRCLTEGVDVPLIDSVLFVDPKKSRVDIVQALGRALRPSTVKEFGYIIIPVLIDDITQIDEFSETEAFADLIVTLRALASYDERIIDYFKDAAVQKYSSDKSFSVVEDIFAVTDTEEIDLSEFRDAINIKCWDNIVKLSFSDYEKSKRFVHQIGLKDEKEWEYYCLGQLHGVSDRLINIPDRPNEVYKDSWKSWDDWLGKEISKFHPLKFTFAREWARDLGISSEFEWNSYVKATNPKNIPTRPHVIYYQEWRGWGDWLGIKVESGIFLGFEEARLVARNKGLKFPHEWIAYVRVERRLDVPKRPDLYYKAEWKGWINWLISDIQERRSTVALNDTEINYIQFLEQRDFARALRLSSAKVWHKMCSGGLGAGLVMPAYIEASPQSRWPSFWINWGDWLKSDSIATTINESKTITPNRTASSNREYIEFNQAREYVRRLGIRTKKGWKDYCNGRIYTLPSKPRYIPSNPQKVYASNSEWRDWRDWLGEGKAPREELIPFNLARVYARKLPIESIKDWQKYAVSDARPAYIPESPDLAYSHEWLGWDDWLVGHL